MSSEVETSLGLPFGTAKTSPAAILEISPRASLGRDDKEGEGMLGRDDNDGLLTFLFVYIN